MTLPSSLDPRTPVLVGAATLTQRIDDPGQGDDALGLMRRVAAAAADDSGAAGLLGHLDLVLVPKGIWPHADPGRRVADHFGARPRSVLAEVGVLQQTLLTRAAQAIAAGHLDVALVVGGEDKERQRQRARAGLEPETDPGPGKPDEIWLPDGDIVTRTEIERDLAVPAHQYALIEQALRHADGLDDQAEAERLGALWGGFAAVAATRPDAWDRSAPSPTDIVEPAADNRMLATPYTRRLCSQWNVDQAGALILVSAAEADRRHIPRDRWIFPWASAESDAMIPLSARADLHRSPATALVGRALVDAVDGLASLERVEEVDLYSCFPAAVGVQARELGLDEARPLTITGGMTFGGGPLNNYVLQSTATMVERLRAAPEEVGLVTSVSGMLTKPAGALWSTRPPDRPFTAREVTERALADTATRALEPDATGPGTIVAATVVHDRGVVSRAVAVVETASRSRTVAVCRDTDTVVAMTRGDWCDRAVELVGPGSFELR